MANVPLLCSEYLYCPVCLDLFREPVTIPCGHTFCLTCITQCWSLQGMPASCPQCRSCFQQESSPRLCKNSILSQMVDDFSKLQGATERMAVGNIPARSVGIPLKMNLLQDVSEENIGSEASIGFAIPSSGEVQESSSTQISGARKIVGQGLADIVRVLQASGLRLLKMMDQAECQILKNTESRELEALYISVPQSAQVVPDQLQDQLQEVPLEEQDTQWNGLYAAVTNFKECLQEMCADHMGRLVQQVWCTQSSYPVSPPKLWGFPLQPLIPRIRAEFLQYLREVTLDPETAHHNLCLTQGNHRVLCKLQPQAYSDHPGRFDHYTQVLGRESMGHGRHYWEVHLSGNRVSLGVTYHNISRKGHQSYCLAGRNSKSWCLEWSSSRCYAWHDGQRILVATGLQEKLGIFLDWDEGSLSFHEVSDDMPLLHQFNTSFIQLVYPIFYVSWNSIMSIGEAMPTHQSDHNKRFYRQMSAEF